MLAARRFDHHCLVKSPVWLAEITIEICVRNEPCRCPPRLPTAVYFGPSPNLGLWLYEPGPGRTRSTLPKVGGLEDYFSLKSVEIQSIFRVYVNLQSKKKHQIVVNRKPHGIGSIDGIGHSAFGQAKFWFSQKCSLHKDHILSVESNGTQHPRGDHVPHVLQFRASWNGYMYPIECPSWLVCNNCSPFLLIKSTIHWSSEIHIVWCLNYWNPHSHTIFHAYITETPHFFAFCLAKVALLASCRVCHRWPGLVMLGPRPVAVCRTEVPKPQRKKKAFWNDHIWILLLFIISVIIFYSYYYYCCCCVFCVCYYYYYSYYCYYYILLLLLLLLLLVVSLLSVSLSLSLSLLKNYH